MEVVGNVVVVSARRGERERKTDEREEEDDDEEDVRHAYIYVQNEKNRREWSRREVEAARFSSFPPPPSSLFSYSCETYYTSNKVSSDNESSHARVLDNTTLD